jgi:hypothetical protein
MALVVIVTKIVNLVAGLVQANVQGVLVESIFTAGVKDKYALTVAPMAMDLMLSKKVALNVLILLIVLFVLRSFRAARSAEVGDR